MMIPYDPLQQILGFDKASPKFHEQLQNFLRGDAYRNTLPNLQNENLTLLVECLDNALVGISDCAIPVFRDCLRELMDICGDKEVLPKPWTLSESLLGCVYKGSFNGSKVRIRRVRMYSGGDPRKVKEAFHKVAVISKRSAHPNIVPLLGVTMDPLELISDWVPGGGLPRYIAKHPDANKISLLSDVAEGLNYLHSCDVIHGDLKGSNILVDATDRARITDFGLAMVTQYLGSIRNASAEDNQTARWIAPEILDGEPYSKEADIFSFAGVTIEVFTGVAPFSGKSSHEAESAVRRGERPPRPMHPTLTDEIWGLIQQCWNQEAGRRPHALRITCGLNGVPAWKCLIDRPLASDECISLITDIFSDPNDTEAVKCLHGDDAQSFVDVIDKVVNTLALPLRRKCLGVLRTICGKQSLLPRSVQITPRYNRSDPPQYQGGYADVWESEYQNRKVAVKVLRVYQLSNLDKITRRFCKEVVMWKGLDHQNVLPLLGAAMSDKHFTMISEWMDNGNINEFIKVHEHVNRFELLKDVARGLIYLHGQEMVHGDLKGVNILIDQGFHARLADFGLLTFAADSTNPTISTSTTSVCGTIRWMSPELLYPERFGFEDSRPTKASDCYALGMVILEVLRGKPPFAGHLDPVVMHKVLLCEHPERLNEVWSINLWGTLEQCWSFPPGKRPTAEVIFDRLGRVLHEPIVWGREDRNTTATADRSGVSSSYWTAMTHPTERLDQGNFIGMPGRSPIDYLQEQDPLVSFGFRSRDNGRTFPGVTVQPGDYFGIDPNESSAASSPGSVSYDKLQTLDRSSPQFPDKLSDILARREFGESILSLETNDLVQIIEYLDQTLDDLSATSSAFEHTHRKLQRICVSRMLLPPSHTLSDVNLTIDERPFASSYSDAHKGRYNGLEVCIKKLRVPSMSELEKAIKVLFREALMWKRLVHPNIVPFKGVSIDPPQIVSEWMPNGDLTTYIKSNPQRDPVSLLVDVAKGLDYLHSQGVIHGDLKGPNILVDASGNARITDFALAQHTSRVVSMAERQNMRWTAPEVLAETGAPSTEADVFSFGMVVVETCTGAVPFSDHIAPAAMTAIIGGKRPSRPTHPSLTDGLWKLTNRCWDQERRNRPRMLEVLIALTHLVHEHTRPSGSQPVTADVETLVSDIQRQLENLDPSHEEYRRLLHALLNHQDLKPHIDGLRKGDLQGFVELLNKALNHIPVTDDLFRETLRRLQSTCSNREALPRAYILPGGALSNRGAPFASGRSADAREAKFYGQRVCIKTLRPNIQSKTFYRGIIVWKRLKHPNIVPFLGVLISVPPLGIVHDWMENGTITDYVRKHPQLDRAGLLWDVAEGLHYLHLYNVIHGDLKGTNVLIDNDGHARLTDFGLTSVILGNKSVVSFQDDHLTMETMWTAPEISEGGVVTKEGDVFMFAMVAVETFTEHPLSVKCYAALSAGRHPQRPATLADDLWNLMQRCWSEDPRKRPTTFELVDFFRPSFLRERETWETQYFSSELSEETLASPESGNTRSHSNVSAVEPEVGGDALPKVPENRGPSRSKGRGLFRGGKRVTPTPEHELSTPTHKTSRRRRFIRFGSGSSS